MALELTLGHTIALDAPDEPGRVSAVPGVARGGARVWHERPAKPAELHLDVRARAVHGVVLHEVVELCPVGVVAAVVVAFGLGDGPEDARLVP